MFLTEQDLRDLTGRQRPSAQIRWLQREGWRHTVNALGDPVVAVDEKNRKLVGGAARKTDEPNWSALNGSAA